MALPVGFYPKAINYVSSKCIEHILVLPLCLNNGAKSHISTNSLHFWKMTNLKDYSSASYIQFYAKI